MASFEGDFDNDDDDDLEDAFGTLLVDYKDDSSSEEELTNSLAPSFFTSIASFTTKSSVPYVVVSYVENLVSNLNDQALMHQLTNRLPSEPKDILTNDFTDNFTTRNTSRYDSHHFCYGSGSGTCSAIPD
jgi:hypothetical protein